jgi:hypothetical protein
MGSNQNPGYSWPITSSIYALNQTDLYMCISGERTWYSTLNYEIDIMHMFLNGIKIIQWHAEESFYAKSLSFHKLKRFCSGSWTQSHGIDSNPKFEMVEQNVKGSEEVC